MYIIEIIRTCINIKLSSNDVSGTRLWSFFSEPLRPRGVALRPPRLGFGRASFGYGGGAPKQQVFLEAEIYFRLFQHLAIRGVFMTCFVIV